MINFPYYFFEDFLDESQIKYVNETYWNKRIKPDEEGTEWKNVNSWNIDTIINCEVMNKINWNVFIQNEKHFGYDLYPRGVNNGNLNYYTDDKNDYDWHQDAAPYNHKDDMKITFLVNISTKKYVGGKLQLFPGYLLETPELDKPGNAIMFPSFTPHKVTPVIEGERISFSTWFSGPGFK